jgi:hypothetical protein
MGNLISNSQERKFHREPSRGQTQRNAGEDKRKVKEETPEAESEERPGGSGAEERGGQWHGGMCLLRTDSRIEFHMQEAY